MPNSSQKPIINFYIIKSDNFADCLPLACKIIDKAYKSNSSTFVYTKDKKINVTLDEMLWTFLDNSFIPHSSDPKDLDISPIYLGTVLPESVQHSLFINLTDNIQTDFQQYSKIIEFICQDTSHKELGRKKYTFYKQNECEINTYNL